MENYVLNDVLSFIMTSRVSLSRDMIIANALAFYKAEAILKAKDVIFEVNNEKTIKRKACNAHPNPTVADLEDICSNIEKIESSNIPCPKFVASGYLSMPPGSGFEALASGMCSLRDEISALRLEVSEIRKSNERDIKSFENLGCIGQDIAEIKIHVQKSSNKINDSIEVTNDEYFEASNEVLSSLVDGDHTTRTNISASNVVSSNESMSVRPKTTSSGDLPRTTYAGALQKNSVATSSRNITPKLQVQSTLTTNRGYRADGKSKRNIRKSVISGTKSDTNGLSSGSRILDVFVGGCGVETTENSIVHYCTVNGVNVRKCEVLDGKSEWTKSFKVSIEANKRDDLLNADFWPKGIFVRKFFRARKTTR